MSAPASSYEYYTTADTFTISEARMLRRVVIGTGATSATVTVSDGESNTIAVLDAASPFVFDFDVKVLSGLSIVTDSGDTEVTVVYD